MTALDGCLGHLVAGVNGILGAYHEKSRGDAEDGKGGYILSGEGHIVYRMTMDIVELVNGGTLIVLCLLRI